MILDEQMPGRSGLDAITEIKLRAPSTAIIVYTAHTDQGVYQAAYDAGACEVLEKVSAGGHFVERLVASLVDRASVEDEMMDIHIGPTDAGAARIWITNTLRVIDALVEHPEVLIAPLPTDVVELYRSLLRQWEAIARTTSVLRLVVRSSPSDIHRLAHYWGTVDALPDAALRKLGVDWAPEDGGPFFEALTAGVLDSLERHAETARLAMRLNEQWSRFKQPGSRPAATP